MLSSALFSIGGTWGDHVGLEEHTFEENLVFKKGLHHLLENSFRNFSADINAVVSIGEDFWFDNGNKSVFLADSSVSSKRVSSLEHCSLAWSSLANLNNSSPLGESASLFVVLLASFSETVEALSGVLIVGLWDDDETLVDLDTWNDALALEEFNEVNTVNGLLVEGFLEHDDS